MDVAKISIGKLEGKSNWATWKYKIELLLRKITDGPEVVEGELSRPCQPEDGAAEEVMTNYKLELARFRNADSDALLVISSTMNDEIVKKIMRFKTSREAWLELHRLYEGSGDDRAYDICQEFFSVGKDEEDDIASHLSKLKNMWNDLKVEMDKDKVELPEMFLISKVLATLPEGYFSFKASWMLIAKHERTIENLTDQLCAFQRALKGSDGKCAQEVLAIGRRMKSSNMKFRCHYCDEPGHIVRFCARWNADGRPPKRVDKQETRMVEEEDNLPIVLSIGSGSLLHEGEWFVDNGAEMHVARQRDSFQNYARFDQVRTVTSASGHRMKVQGKGTVKLYSRVNDNIVQITLADVWHVPALKRNVFSPLAAQEKNPQSRFVSSYSNCRFQLRGKDVLVGYRRAKGGLFKLDVESGRRTQDEASAASAAEEDEDHVSLTVSVEENRGVNIDNKPENETVSDDEDNYYDCVELDEGLCEGVGVRVQWENTREAGKVEKCYKNGKDRRILRGRRILDLQELVAGHKTRFRIDSIETAT